MQPGVTIQQRPLVVPYKFSIQKWTLRWVAHRDRPLPRANAESTIVVLRAGKRRDFVGRKLSSTASAAPSDKTHRHNAPNERLPFKLYL